MKSDFKSFRVKCVECGRIVKVSSPVMDSRAVYLYCASTVCQAHTIHKKVD